MRTFPIVALFCTAGEAGYAHELETVKRAYQRAIPNIPGKNLVALLVNYPPGGKSPAHRHAKAAFIYAYVLTGPMRSIGGHRTRESLPSRRELPRRTRSAS